MVHPFGSRIKVIINFIESWLRVSKIGETADKVVTGAGPCRCIVGVYCPSSKKLIGVDIVWNKVW
jgi:hypothetical protein